MSFMQTVLCKASNSHFPLILFSMKFWNNGKRMKETYFQDILKITSYVPDTALNTRDRTMHQASDPTKLTL